MNRILSSRRAFLQVTSFSALWILVAAAIRQYHHSTDDTFVPFSKYLLSMRLAVPPLVGLFASYSLLFMGGVTLADAPGRVVRFFRNIFFQSEWMMILSSIVCLLISGVIFYRASTEAPPAYAHLITQFLGSENDDGIVIANRIKKLQDDGLKIGDQLDLVQRVFAERKARNLDGKAIEKTTPRNLVRALEANQIDDEWRVHPLRWHALGEAYSMWAQAANSSLIERPSQSEVEGLMRKALDAYGNVLGSKDWRATSLMRFSAELNIGNIHLYAGQFDKAEKAYLNVMGKNRNLSTAGNLMALYLMTKPPRIDECVGRCNCCSVKSFSLAMHALLGAAE